MSELGDTSDDLTPARAQRLNDDEELDRLRSRLASAEADNDRLHSALRFEHSQRVIHNVRGKSPPCAVCDLLDSLQAGEQR